MGAEIGSGFFLKSGYVLAKIGDFAVGEDFAKWCFDLF
jgi:hypothetical protein